MTPRDCAAVCAICPEADRLGWDPVVCTVSGKTCQEHCVTGSCPAGHFSASSPETVSLGIRWYGPSMLSRLLLRAVHPRRPRPSSFTGCGCIKILKDLWSKLRAHPR